MQDHLDEIEAALEVAAKGIPRARAEERGRFMKVSMPLLGLTVPQQRKLLARGYGFSHLPAQEQLPIWSFVWFNAETHEAKMQAGLYVYALKNDSPPAELWRALQPWADAINCWDQSDTLSGIYARILEAESKLVMPTLRAWNRDPDPWKRRQSVVSLFYYAALRERVPPVTRALAQVKALLGDEDYYVQKGVGWALRESFNAYPEPTLAFLETHAGDVAPAAFSAAIEKLTAAQKKRVKTLRKQRRGR